MRFFILIIIFGIISVLAYENLSKTNVVPLSPILVRDQQQQIICTPGHAKSIRMSLQDSERIKKQMMTAIGATDPSAYELDHLDPLELSIDNSANDISNLRLEPIDKAIRKDYYENYYHNLYCSGSISLENAVSKVEAYE